MKLSLKKITSLLFVSFFLIFLNSCSKDSDLLSEYVVQNSDPLSSLDNRVFDDTFFIQDNNAIILDVLQNDLFDNLNNVRIVETSSPTSGTIVINADNTLTYTPQTVVEEPTDNSTNVTIPDTTNEDTSTESEPANEESTESSENTTETETDTFIYVTEETNDDGVVTTEEGSVTISKNELPTSGDNIYYVTVNGNSSNNGRSEQSSWNISHAFSVARAGDVVYVKAGDYGNKHLEVSNSGNENQPISFIGYTSVPGDVQATVNATFTYENYKNQGDNVNPNYLPTLSGINEGRENRSGSGIIIEKQFINISNFQIRKMSYGIYTSQASNVILDNIIQVNIASEIKSESGRAFPFNYTSNSTIKNSIVINAGTGGIFLYSSNNNTIINNKVYSDNNINATDYYIWLYGDSSGNHIENVRIEKVGDLEHPGHGLGGHHKVYNNTFTNFEIINTSLELSFAAVENNTFSNFSITGNFEEQKYHNAIQIANGAQNNVFENFTITNGNGIQFLEWDYDTTEWNIYNEDHAGKNNIFRNGEIKNCNYGIVFHHLFLDASPAENNTFDNITFDGISLALFAVNRPNSGNKMINCKVNNVSKLWETRNGNTLNFDYGNTIFTSVGFPIPN